MKTNQVENICSEIISADSETYTPMAPQIVQTSSFYFESYEEFMDSSADEKNHYIYTRGSNPTVRELETKLARLEGGKKCKVFASGMGAISATIFSLLQSGDHILMVNTVYGETVRFAQYLNKFGVILDKIDVAETEDISGYITKKTKMIYFESPSSQKFELLDLRLVSEMAKAHNIYTVIDATWASPIFQNPLKEGIDIVIHSMSKYIGGHSDLVGGAIIGNDMALINKIFEDGHQALGATISPFNAWLAIRGLRTLPVRMKQFDESIRVVLDGIKNDPRIMKIEHPYCSDGLQRKLADKYLTGYGSLFGIDIRDQDFDKLKVFVNELKVMSIGVSWGGFESLALPAFKGKNQADLKKRGLEKTHIRMYVGLENAQTIIDDIKQALDIAYGKINNTND